MSTAPVVPAALDPSDPIAQLNDGFREAYAARREAVLATLDPAIAQIDDSLILRLAGRRLVGPARTRVYHELKTVCHLPLAIQAVLEGEASLAEPARGRLVELQRRAAAVEGGIAERGLSAEQTARQRRILRASLEFMAAVLAAEAVDGDALGRYLRGQMPDIRDNLADAARDQLHTTHATLGAWAREMSAEQWSQLRVVIAASHMARIGNVAAQYFSVALGDHWGGRFERDDEGVDARVVTAEDVRDEHAAFALLAMHKFDRRAANAFFGEEGRLGRDVLADATERELVAMFGQLPRGR